MQGQKFSCMGLSEDFLNRGQKIVGGGRLDSTPPVLIKLRLLKTQVCKVESNTEKPSYINDLDHKSA